MLVNRTTGEVLATQITHCDTFWSRLRGLMFRRALGPEQAYVFSYRRESIAETAIHMFFVFQEIAVVWLDAQWRVVETARARPFRPYYAPSTAAQYIVEAAPGMLAYAHVGDVWVLEEERR